MLSARRRTAQVYETGATGRRLCLLKARVYRGVFALTGLCGVGGVASIRFNAASARATVSFEEYELGSSLGKGASGMSKAHTGLLTKEQNDLITAHEINLGRLCMTWAALDHQLDALFQPLLECSRKQVAALVGNIDNTAMRCEMLKRLIWVEAPSEAWREWFVKVLDRTSGELASVRNRYVHDTWSIIGQPFTRTDRRAKVLQIQAHQPPQLVFDTKHAAAPGEVEKFVMAVSSVLAALAFATQDLRHWRKTGRPIEPSPQLIPVSMSRARYRTPREHLEALGQGRPPSDYVFDP